jgi:hypothetical protein
MTGAVERHAALPQPVFLAVLNRVQGDVLPEALPEHAFTAGHGPVLTASGTGMVGMGMGDQGSGDWTPGVDPGIGRSAVQPLRGAFNHS